MKRESPEYKAKLFEALKDMKTKTLQKFFDENDWELKPIYRRSTETERKITLCQLIVQNKEFEGTEQMKKATSYLRKKGLLKNE